MKRISLALVALGLSAGAFAALPAATDPTIVNVPQLPGGFVIGLSGYYLQPTNSNGDLDYAAVNASTSGSNSSFFASSLHNVDPGYDWGWGANVGYIFPNTGNDVNLNYLHLDTSDTSSGSTNGLRISPIANDFNFPVFFDIHSSGSAASAKAEYDLDQVDLTAGQFINVGCRLTLHPFAGLRWAQLERKLGSTYEQTASGNIIGTTNSVKLTQINSFAEKSDFEGIGPIVGLDASYYLGMGFGLAAHADTALLVGNIDASTAETVSVLEGARSFSANTSATADDTRRVVPVLDAKLGADYTYVFNNAANSDLTLEIGWQVSNYFNAVDRLATSTDVTQTVTTPTQRVFAVTGFAVNGRSTSDMGLSGPYASLVLHV